MFLFHPFEGAVHVGEEFNVLRIGVLNPVFCEAVGEFRRTVGKDEDKSTGLCVLDDLLEIDHRRRIQAVHQLEIEHQIVQRGQFRRRHLRAHPIEQSSRGSKENEPLQFENDRALTDALQVVAVLFRVLDIAELIGSRSRIAYNGQTAVGQHEENKSQNKTSEKSLHEPEDDDDKENRQDRRVVNFRDFPVGGIEPLAHEVNANVEQQSGNGKLRQVRYYFRPEKEHETAAHCRNQAHHAVGNPRPGDHGRGAEGSCSQKSAGQPAQHVSGAGNFDLAIGIDVLLHGQFQAACIHQRRNQNEQENDRNFRYLPKQGEPIGIGQRCKVLCRCPEAAFRKRSQKPAPFPQLPRRDAEIPGNHPKAGCHRRQDERDVVSRGSSAFGSPYPDADQSNKRNQQ